MPKCGAVGRVCPAQGLHFLPEASRIMRARRGFRRPPPMVRSKPLLSFLFATCLVVPAFSQLEPRWPPDSNAYTRKAIAEDKRPAGNLAIKALQFGTPTFSDVFIR